MSVSARTSNNFFFFQDYNQLPENMFARFLAEDDHGHDDHDHGPASDEDKVLMARIIMIIFILLAGAVVFLPFTKLLKT